MRVRHLGILVLCLLLAPLAQAAPLVHEYTLKNGLKVIIKEDHRAPVVVSQIWYKVGSSYEHRGITGISHVLEHMMFKGTPKHPAGQFSRIISENGGRENAFTSRDYTAYFQQLEKSKLPIAFELEADRMRHLTLPPKEFDKERQVVMEERRMRTEDNPQALTYEQFMATAFLTSPYHNPVIGWKDDLEHLTVQQLRQWYHRWYAPDNAILVVVGDVDPAHVRALAQKYFGPVKPSRIAPPSQEGEIKQIGERRIIVKRPAELPYLLMGYKTPVLTTAKEKWKAYALEVLAGILDGGDSARLSRDLVRGRQVAASAGAGYDLYARQESLLTLDGVPAKGHTVKELEQALREEIRRLREHKVAADELARVKAQVAAAKVYERDSIFYQAMQIGMLEAVGLDWRDADNYVKHVRAVTPEQVQQVAKEFLTDDNLTVGILDPQPMDEAARRAMQHSGGAHDVIR